MSFYDGVNPNQWMNVNKPTTLLTWADLAIAWSAYPYPWGNSQWITISKPT